MERARSEPYVVARGMANNHFQNKARAVLLSLRALARRAMRKSNARPRHAHYAVVPPDPLALVLHDRQGTLILVQGSAVSALRRQRKPYGDDLNRAQGC